MQTNQDPSEVGGVKRPVGGSTCDNNRTASCPGLAQSLRPLAGQVAFKPTGAGVQAKRFLPDLGWQPWHDTPINASVDGSEADWRKCASCRSGADRRVARPDAGPMRCPIETLGEGKEERMEMRDPCAAAGALPVARVRGATETGTNQAVFQQRRSSENEQAITNFVRRNR